MEIRDFFAGMALAGTLAYKGEVNIEGCYKIADKMLAFRKSGDLNSLDLAEAVFIGGPWDGQVRRVDGEHSIDCDPGQYHRQFLGLDGKCFEMVYVWSELHAEEAVDLVIKEITKRKGN